MHLHQFQDLTFWAHAQFLVRARFKNYATANVNQGIKLLDKRNTVCDKDTSFGSQQPPRSDDIIYRNEVLNFNQGYEINIPKTCLATWLSTAARQSSRSTLDLMSRSCQ